MNSTYLARQSRLRMRNQHNRQGTYLRQMFGQCTPTSVLQFVVSAEYIKLPDHINKNPT